MTKKSVTAVEVTETSGGNEGRDVVNQMLGQIQMSRAISKFTDVVSLGKLKQIKENKLYRCVAGQKAVDASGKEIADVGTWAGFCAALGVSVSKIDEDLLNLNSFGEDALQQLHSVGLGYRELRQFRRLPEDEQQALLAVAESGDKDALIEFAETVIAKHSKEKEALRGEITSLSAEKTNAGVDRDKAIAERDSLAKQLKRRSQSEEDSGVPIVVLDIRAEAAALVKKAELALTSIYPLGVELAGLHGHDLAGPWVEPSTRLVLAGLVALQVQLAGLVSSYAESIDADVGMEPPAGLAHLQPSEVQAVAKEWAELTALHKHEADLRQHERAAARPRGKGRPASAPQLKADPARN